ncbi:translation initiation factor IF-2 associated domain-containing protein, partial [Caenispirillum bisanense]|uniref:translation initiation factor IF-2 associated domain-containing protein n=1 Tax=Caenispirillum bisanense TaxID=414052 RepID=UPI0031E404D6
MANENERKAPLTLGKGKLELPKRVETDQVKQSFSHGRTKVVQVERRKKRHVAPGAEGQAPQGAEAPAAEAPQVERAASPGGVRLQPKSGRVEPPRRDTRGVTPPSGNLANEERQRRLAALQGAIIDQKRREEEEARRAAEEAARRKAEEEERRKREAEEARRAAEEEAARRAAEAAAASQPAAPVADQ